ncbi:hypothetical protein AB0D97_37020, partial [Streptomyces roseus]|uniref:hypothetical protein n=1 Tax=Streptomyces roseus TaxID=66430 RepID=UPI0033D63609
MAHEPTAYESESLAATSETGFAFTGVGYQHIHTAVDPEVQVRQQSGAPAVAPFDGEHHQVEGV